MSPASFEPQPASTSALSPAARSGKRGAMPPMRLVARGAPVLHRHRPALVVAPAPRHLEVTRGEPLAPEPGPLEQDAGGGVGRLHVGLDAVQAEAAEGVAQD